MRDVNKNNNIIPFRLRNTQAVGQSPMLAEQLLLTVVVTAEVGLLMASAMMGTLEAILPSISS